MILFKACPRCGGDVYPEKDLFDTNYKCLQCGHVLNQTESQTVDQLIASRAATSASKPKDKQRAERAA